MKAKSKRVSNVRRADGAELSEKALERTNNNTVAYKADEESNKCIDNDNNIDKSNFCDNNTSINNNGNDDDNNDSNIVPFEIDSHFQLYGKRAWEVEYGERCPLCNKRIDEYGLCACGSGGE
jgi:hypothetical protein